MQRYQHTKNNWYEADAWSHDSYVCGIDEVGRGCLAGPVVVVAAVIPKRYSVSFLIDSKKTTLVARLKAYEWIMKHCYVSVSLASNHVIEQRNIYRATQKLMRKSFLQLTYLPHVELKKIRHVVVDAMPLHVQTLPGAQHINVDSFPFAESHSATIAAASIVAKVVRDNLVCKLATHYPSYLFEKHKGYATKIHKDALRFAGASIIHRPTFIKSTLGTRHANNCQTTIFE